MKHFSALLGLLLAITLATPVFADSTISGLNSGGTIQTQDQIPVYRPSVPGTDFKVSVGSAATQTIGTSGPAVPLLSTTNTWSGLQSFLSGDLTAADPTFTGGSISLPAGTTSQRPGSPVNGMLRYNSTTPGVEGYVNGAWGPLGGNTSSGITALTGVVTASGTGSVATTFGTFPSSTLAAAISDETGSGAAVFGTSPTITGATITGTINGVTPTAAGSATTFLNGAGGYTTPASSGGVTTFNTRAGAVVSANGDYTVSQVTGAAPLASPTFTGAVNGVSATWSAADTALNFTASGNGANTLPAGTTAQRPTGSNGMLRYNSTLPAVEAYVNGSWQSLLSGLVNLATSVTGTLPMANGGSGLVSGLTYNSSAAASANTTAINTALASGGHVKIDCAPSGQTIYTNAPLVVYSNTDFEVNRGCTVRQASGTNSNMLVNYAYTQAWTVVYDSTGSITNGPLNITALTNLGSWATSQSYTKGAERYTAGNQIYWESATSCTSASSGTGPSGTGTGITDGTCTWNYITTVPYQSGNNLVSVNNNSYYAIINYPSHGLSYGNFVWVSPEGDVAGNNYWSGTQTAGTRGGPADTSYFGVFPIVAVNDANYITVQLRRAPAAQFTGIPINVKAADDNIRISGGGVFNYDSANNASPANVQQDHSIMMTGVHHLIMDNITGINSLKFFVYTAGLSDADIGHVQGGASWAITSQTNGDTIHLYGPQFDTYVHDIVGAMGQDDIVALQTQEPNNASYTPNLVGSGDLLNVTLRNITGNGQGVAIYGSHALEVMQNIVLDNIDPFFTPLTTGISPIHVGGTYAYTYGSIDGLTIENSRGRNANVPFINMYLDLTASVTNLDVHNNNYDTANNNGFLNISPNTTATGSVSHVSVHSNHYGANKGGIYNAQFVGIGCSTGGNTFTVSDVNIYDNSVYGTGGQNGYVFDTQNCTSGLALSRVAIVRNQLNNLSGVVYGALAADFDVSDNHITATPVVFQSFGASQIYHFTNNNLNTGTVLDYTTGASGATLYGGGNALSGGATWFTYGVSALTTAYGYDIQGDVTKMNRVTGEFMSNTNTAPGSGTLTTAGPVMDQGTSSNSWFLMSNPSGQQY